MGEQMENLKKEMEESCSRSDKGETLSLYDTRCRLIGLWK